MYMDSSIMDNRQWTMENGQWTIIKYKNSCLNGESFFVGTNLISKSLPQHYYSI
jgi:hypothetical protein